MCEHSGVQEDTFLVGPALHRTSHELRRTLDAYIATLCPPEFSSANSVRGQVLGYIVRCDELGGDVFQRDIEAKFCIRRSSVTALLQGMEQSGWIQRQSVLWDARLKKLLPTEKGLACHRALCALLGNFEQELQQGLAPGETQQLQSILEQLSENLSRLQCAHHLPQPPSCVLLPDDAGAPSGSSERQTSHHSAKKRPGAKPPKQSLSKE